MSMDKILFYPVWISVGRKDDAVSWGEPCDTAKEAREILKDRVGSGRASMGVVVRFGDSKRVPMQSYVYPASAEKVIRHWEEIKSALRERE